MTIRLFTITLAWLAATLVQSPVSLAQLQSRTPPAATQPVKAAPVINYVLHLPGIDGIHGMDRELIKGLRQGGFRRTNTYDWTARDPGINALHAIKRNHVQAKHVADMIVNFVQAHPTAHIHLISHSGGTGIAVWALEDLPANVKVYSLVMLSSALSPEYDLSKALSHVKHKAYAFNSLKDSAVLGLGTILYGTIDGPYARSGGYIGFTMPANGDAKEYKKLVQYDYDPLWMKYDNGGDHIGPMHTQFAKNVLAPLILKDKAPPQSLPAADGAGATTQHAVAQGP
jgi:pimeloyl-ACP methyl ester carboxylesterase